MNQPPSPAQQSMNLIRYIGDQVTESGKAIKRLRLFSESIGAPSDELADQILDELAERRLVRVGSTASAGGGKYFLNVTLSLPGWERYEEEKRGHFKGNHGFIAMKFDDPILDPFVRDIVKPAVKEGTGYTLADMRDVGRAGVIDNIMRTEIRDSAFVIVDLTHDNHGAYWEAGYAEGLGKPVVYICERKKFEDKPPHFDTHHCTTVRWCREEPDRFCQELIATLRRSLDE